VNKVLVFAVHPDDETLGCGGSLLKHKADGDEIHWLICTKADSDSAFYQKREEEITLVADEYGFSTIQRLDFKAMCVDQYSVSALIEQISKVMNTVKPNVVYLPFHNDVHSDHRRIFEAAYSCTKNFRYPFIDKIYMMEVLSETEFGLSIPGMAFSPNSFVDISEYLEKKIEIMKRYESEIALHPFPRSPDSIRALAKLRGSTIGCNYAEAFMLLKEIVK